MLVILLLLLLTDNLAQAQVIQEEEPQLSCMLKPCLVGKSNLNFNIQSESLYSRAIL